MRLAPLSTRTKTVWVEVTRLDLSQGDFKLKPPLEFKRWHHGNPSLQQTAQSERPYRLYIPSPSTLLSRSYPLSHLCWCTPLPYIYDIFRHFTTYLDTFRQFWHILRYIYFELDKTGSNICNGDDVKMVTSDLSARINDVLRYVGITRNMKAYIILSQALTLIAEDEDRLRAVKKEIYTPIADKNPYGPIAVQSTIRRASKIAWDLYPERVQALAGYPLNGRPSAVTMLELLYNGVARYDDLSILK